MECPYECVESSIPDPEYMVTMDPVVPQALPATEHKGGRIVNAYCALHSYSGAGMRSTIMELLNDETGSDHATVLGGEVDAQPNRGGLATA